MAILIAVIKYTLRKVSEMIHDAQERKAKEKAYAETGKIIKFAKRRHRYVNGSAIYQKKYEKYMKPVNRKTARREKLISESF